LIKNGHRHRYPNYMSVFLLAYKKGNEGT
jgi:hypothetical protein